MGKSEHDKWRDAVHGLPPDGHEAWRERIHEPDPSSFKSYCHLFSTALKRSPDYPNSSKPTEFKNLRELENRCNAEQREIAEKRRKGIGHSR
jgi:hypothetical protein